MNKFEITKAQERQLITAMEHDRVVFDEIIDDLRWATKYGILATILFVVSVATVFTSYDRLSLVSLLFGAFCMLIAEWFHRRAHKREDQLEFPKVFDELIGDKIKEDFKEFMKRYIDE